MLNGNTKLHVYKKERKMASQLTHMCSLRIPKAQDEWIKQFADRYQVKAAYVYRLAVSEFIRRKTTGI